MSDDPCTLAASLLQEAQAGNQHAVLETLTALIRVDSSPVWRTLRARLRLEKGEDACEDAQEAVKLAPRSPEALTLRLLALDAQHGDARSSEVLELDEALAAHPTDAQRAELDALAQRQAKRAEPDICTLGSQATVAWRQGRLEEAKGLFAQLLVRDPTSTLWPVAFARIHLAEEHPEEALKLCTEALARTSSGQAELLLVRALANRKLGHEEEAREDLLRVKTLGGLGREAAKELDHLRGELFRPESRTVDTKDDAQKASETPVPKEPNPEAPKQSAQNWVARARLAELEGNFRLARSHCEEALELVPHMPQAVLCLARMELANSEYEAVAELLGQVHPIVLAKAPARIEALSLKAGALEREKNWEAANAELELLAPLVQKLADEKATPLPPQEGWVPEPELQEVLGRLARSRWHSGKRQAATSLADRILEVAPTQLEACEVACAVLMERGDAPVALAVMVRCLVAHRAKTSLTCSELVCGVMRHCSVEELCHVLAPNELSTPSHLQSVAEVVGYVGLIMKERGEILEACRLYRRAVIMSPDHGSLCLNLMHTYALRRDELRALAWAKRFLCRQPIFAPLLAVLQNQTVPEAAFTVKDFQEEHEFHDAVAIGLVIFKLLFLAQPFQGTETSEPSWLPRLRDCDVESHIVGPQVQSLLEDLWRRPAPLTSKALVGAKQHAQVLRRLGKLLAKCCQGHELHLTAVRNENAYFNCIKDILACDTGVPKCPSSFRPLYVVGDSHVLPLAWQFLDIPAEEEEEHFILVPMLVTGAKVWHLREESKFYTMFSFWDKLSILPVDAPVMFMLGEIDCREGILHAVQKGKHSSVEEALSRIVDVYVQLLEQVRKKRQTSRLFVHPVPTVLPETRFLTLAMNELLLSEKTRADMAKVRAKVLDVDSIFRGTTSGVTDAGQLAALPILPELKLDGIHLNPSYVQSHLMPALQRAWTKDDAALKAAEMWKGRQMARPTQVSGSMNLPGMVVSPRSTERSLNLRGSSQPGSVSPGASRRSTGRPESKGDWDDASSARSTAASWRRPGSKGPAVSRRPAKSG
ncbi:unnamed protein product [Effrenium voratum]|nr:unnamed protein product [Effrenium voratum]